jgi:ABC-type nitrate/sulfonate/bicarbonate transport system permease component
MLRLTALVYIVVAPTLFLASMIALLSMSTGLSTAGSSGQAVLGAFAIGMGLGLPAAFLIAKQISAARAKVA